MRSLPELVRIGRSFDQTYTPVLAFEGWKVAMLRHSTAVDSAHLHEVERHWNTNEVFVLTTGQADMIVFDGGVEPSGLHVFPMELHVAYDVQRSVWHHVAMSEDAHIVIFEREETGPETTDYAELDDAAIADVRSRLSPGLR